MDKETVVFMFNGMLVSYKKGGNLVICNNMSGSWGYYAKWYVWQGKTNIVWSHLYVESKNKQKRGHKYTGQIGCWVRGGQNEHKGTIGANFQWYNK